MRIGLGRLKRFFDFERWNQWVHHTQTRVLIWAKEASGYAPVRLFRRYSAILFVALSATMVSLANATEEQGGLGEIAGTLLPEEVATDSAFTRAPQALFSSALPLVPLADSNKGVDLSAKDIDSVIGEAQLSPENQMFLASALGSNSARDPEEDGGVKIYTVAEGDTVSGIAAQFGITVNTILWANDLDNVDSIRPGDQIFILPVAGFTYVVQSGDTLDSLVAKYKANRDDVIAFNGLPANGELTVGEKIILPGGDKGTPRSTPQGGDTLSRRQYASSTGGEATDITPSFSRPKEGKVGQGHRFPYGYCTWYVAQKRFVPWGGNAGTWLYNSRAYGYKTGKTPTVGSIVVTTENRYYGHVAVVEKVTKDAITVSEMNYVGWAKKSIRQLSRTSRVIKGYIY